MKITRGERTEDQITFRDIPRGGAFKLKARDYPHEWRIYIKTSKCQGYNGNAINLETGRYRDAELDATVVPLPDAEVITHE